MAQRKFWRRCPPSPAEAVDRKKAKRPGGEQEKSGRGETTLGRERHGMGRGGIEIAADYDLDASDTQPNPHAAKKRTILAESG